jgi:hypothetical protein
MKIIRFIFSKGIAGLLLAIGSVASGFLCDRLASSAGYEVDPKSAFHYAMAGAGFILLTLGFNIIFVFVGIIQFKKHRLLPILVGLAAILICLSTFFFPSGFAGWDAFQKRMKEDIRPRDLETWLRSVEATNTAPELSRTVTPEEFAIFGPTNVSYRMPSLEIYRSKLTMICWGSGTPTWAIVLADWRGDGKWQDHLYFHLIAK